MNIRNPKQKEHRLCRQRNHNTSVLNVEKDMEKHEYVLLKANSVISAKNLIILQKCAAEAGP